MGVRGLLNYIKDTPVWESVSISEEITKYRRTYGKGPKIVIDLKTMIYFNIGTIHIGLGGTYFLQTRYLKSFLDRLKKLDAEFVFFSQQREIDSVELVIPRGELTYISGINVIDTLIEKDIRLDENDIREICTPITFHYNVLRLCQQYGDIHYTYGVHNQEMAKYLQKNADALAILTNDSDFAIFDGDFQFWLVDELNMKELTTCNINRKKLTEKIALNYKQMQLLAALSFGSLLPYAAFKTFYDSLGKPRFIKLSNYVRNQLMINKDEKNPRNAYDMHKICCDVFGDEYNEFDRNAIENGIAVYDLNYEIIEPIDSFTLKLKYEYPLMYKLINDDVILLSDYKYIDLRVTQSKTYTELVLPLLRRMQGIVWLNDKGKPKSRLICAKFAHDEPFKLVETFVEYPPCKFPNLEKLIFCINYKSYDAYRWQLLQWMFRFDDKFITALRHLSHFDKKFIAVIITLRYLLQNEVISEDEADAVFLTEHFAKGLDDYMPKYKFTQHYFPRRIRIAHLYAKMYRWISYCLEICGLSYFTDLLTFEASYFHVKMDEFDRNTKERIMLMYQFKSNLLAYKNF